MGSRPSTGLAAALLMAAFAWGDSITIDGVVYEDVYVRESPSAYFVQLPEDGRTISALKSEVDPQDVTISTDEGERGALLARWRERQRAEPEAAPREEVGLSVDVESSYRPPGGREKRLVFEEDRGKRLVLRGDYDFDSVRGTFLAEQDVRRAEQARRDQALAQERRRRAEEEARRQHELTLRGMELAERELRLEEQALRTENEWSRRWSRPWRVRYYGRPVSVYRGPARSGASQTVTQGVTVGGSGPRWIEQHGGNYNVSSPGSGVDPRMRMHGGSYGVPQSDE